MSAPLVVQHGSEAPALPRLPSAAAHVLMRLAAIEMRLVEVEAQLAALGQDLDRMWDRVDGLESDVRRVEVRRG